VEHLNPPERSRSSDTPEYLKNPVSSKPNVS
jgi:hypothetical protein